MAHGASFRRVNKRAYTERLPDKEKIAQAMDKWRENYGSITERTEVVDKLAFDYFGSCGSPQVIADDSHLVTEVIINERENNAPTFILDPEPVVPSEHSELLVFIIGLMLGLLVGSFVSYIWVVSH
jgi:hypothetical protein